MFPDAIGPDGKVRLRCYLPSADSLWFAAGCQGAKGCGHSAPIGIRAAIALMGPEATMTEAEARDLLRDWPGVGGLEAWIAGRRWKTAPGGWTVTGELQGWQFRLEVVPAGLRISASASGGDPAVWVVTG